ncbi:baseplate assembly protein [Blastochloris tepida]|uniref:Baseplate assembly protein n=1 Tax=Blastochloris tepida TaxID=2233851 RepID=A0A348FYH3_9HYPH|nr:baseplate J/gp47 family protein [Blastochloris tepida]BBF92356.1 baseplate assembly protein [Blastochloris tepida]
MIQPTTIDLSQLPAPQLIEALDAESYVAAAIADFRAAWPAYDALLLSDPFQKFIRVLAYREVLLRNRVNAAARSVMLAFAAGSDLDHLAAIFGVGRMVLTPATAIEPAAMESDERFRRRIQLAPDAYSTAGARGAYIYHALTRSPDVADAWAWSPRDGHVHVAVAGAAGTPVADAVIADLIALFDRDDVRPLTDVVTVRRAEPVTVDVAGTLIVPRGPDPTLIRTAAEAAVRAYGAERCRIGQIFYALGAAAAAKVGGVDNVVLSAPAADIVCADHQIPVLGTVSLAVTVV